MIHALGLVKWAAGVVNRDLGKLTRSGKNRLNDKQVEALLAAAKEVAEGKLDPEFPIDVYQTGSGTSSNMNANEVISNRAIEILGGDRFATEKPIHPNDHVNMGQSTNDMFPTAIHVAVALGIRKQLIPALTRLADVLKKKAAEWDKIIKIGRTHLADATPLRLGQEIGGFARQLTLSIERAERAFERGARTSRGGNGRRHRDQYASGIRPPHRQCPSRTKRAFPSSKRSIILRGTRSATGSSSAMASCGRSPQRCSTLPTTSVGSARGRGAAFTSSSSPIDSRAARSCRARSIPSCAKA